MSDNLVSVIIPAYNHERFVVETIQSIINQTYKNIELIIVDDYSDDKTWEHIQNMLEICKSRFINFKYVRNKANLGTCLTLNKLISLSKGSYIYLIASDDVAMPTAIEDELKFLISHDEYGLAVGNNILIDADGKECFYTKKGELTYSGKHSYKTVADYLSHGNHFNFNNKSFGSYWRLIYSNHVPNGYLIKRQYFLKALPFEKEAPLEDYYLLLQLAKYCKFKYIDKILFKYRQHSNNTSSNIQKMMNMTNMTKQFEANNFMRYIDNNSINLKVLNEIKTIVKYGLIIKRFTIFNFFVIDVYKKRKKFTFKMRHK